MLLANRIRKSGGNAWITWAGCFALFCLACLLTPGDAAALSAGDILEETGTYGGFVVHLGCGDGTLAAAFGEKDNIQVQGLDKDAKTVAKAREALLAKGLYGKVMIDRLVGKQLPYIDNMVNLIVVEKQGEVPMSEIMRVLTPLGVAYVKSGNKWDIRVKPRPDNIDDWTHYLHDATGNAVAHDTVVGPPRHLQWVGGPRYSRMHDHMSGASAMVTTGGRLFYIFDHANPLSIQLPPEWFLVARDAFNGTILWKRPIEEWHTQMYKLKSGPAQLTRRLVAVGNKVFVTLGLEAPVSVLDAATGETITTYENTAKTEEIIHSDGVLFLLINDDPFRQPKRPADLNYFFAEGPRHIMAIDTGTGETLWDKPQKNALPITLVADAERVLFCDGESVVALDRKTGDETWKSDKLKRRMGIPSFFGPCLVSYGDMVLFSGGSDEPDDRNRGGGDNTMYGLSAATGETLWKGEHPPSGYKSAEDILIMKDLVWTPSTMMGNDPGLMIGRDLHTGEIKKQFLPDVETHWFHHRCYRAKATVNYLLTSRTGIEFVDPDTEHWECHHWVRGACLYGIMPANGMVYNPPHPCACYLESKLDGFNAVAPETPTRKVPVNVPIKGRLQKGPAYGNITFSALRISSSEDWPTYRNDPARSGYTKTSVPVSVKPEWQTPLGGKLTSVVVAEGKLFVASVDTHTVHALDADSGKPAWHYTAGARVDSPPTIHKGRALFGCADGYVYSLRASDGALDWRFRAAPMDRRMMYFEQLESVWPVHGSVLIREGELWAVAGRSMFTDGGMRLVRLDPETGKLLDEKILDDRDPDSGENLQVSLKGLNMPVALNDILSYDGKYVYMRSQRFDGDGVRQEIEIPTLNVGERGEGPHLFSPTGFLDDIWWHRSYWIFGRIWKSGAGGYHQAGRVNPAGRPMVFNDSTVFGYGRLPQYYKWTTPLEYQLFASAKVPELKTARRGGANRNQGAQGNQAAQRRQAAARQTDQRQQGAQARQGAQRQRANQPNQTAQQRRRSGGQARRPTNSIPLDWTANVPVLTRAMVLADKTIFIAGPPDVIDEVETLAKFDEEATQKALARQTAVYDGSEGALLYAFSTDGEKLCEIKLDSVPVFDGMAAANGRLYMSTVDGKILCLSDR